MLSRTRIAWWWAQALIRLGVAICAVIVGLVIGLRSGVWVGFATSLALLAVLAPKAIILIWLVIPAISDRQYPNPRGLMLRVYQIALILTLCLVALSFITGPVGLTVFCAVCALLTALTWVMIKVASLD